MLRLDLKEPPSSNRYWRVAKGRTYISAEAKAFRAHVHAEYVKAFRTVKVMFPTGAVSIILEWRRGRKSGDLDNRIKQVLDALQGLAYTDDKQITEIHAYRSDAPKNGGLTVTIGGNK